MVRQRVPGSQGDSRKMSIYLASDMAEYVRKEAERLDRSASWVIARSLSMAKAQMAKVQSVERL